MAASTWRKILSTLQIGNDYTVKPAGLRWRSNTYFIVATVAMGMFTDMLLYGLVVPVFPYMLRDRIGIPPDRLQSNVSGLLAAYGAAQVVSSPFAGLLADRMTTRQAPFLLGLLALLGATALLFLGQTLPVLMLARVLQGISAAFVWTIGLALCLETVGPENLGKTIGSIFGFISVGNFAAPLLGGALYEKAGYPGVFGLAFGALALDFIMRLLVIEKKVAVRYDSKDTSASDYDTTSDDQHDGTVEARQADDEEQPLLGSKDEENASFKLSNDQSKLARMVPILPCLADPRLLTAFLVSLIQGLLLGNFDATVPTVAQEYFNAGSLKAGMLFVPVGVSDLLFGPLFGYCVDRFGTKWVSVVSYTYLVPVLVLLRLPHPGGMDQFYLYGGLLALCGVGIAGIGAPSIVEAGVIMEKYYAANPDHFGEQGPYAQLYGLSSMAFSAGTKVKIGDVPRVRLLTILPRYSFGPGTGG
ncbi:hypothetical protein LTR56_018700 [Elasticomyces elasticus]|nr:hypothetical protein LTR56_018700 [Elasticomyces elasticus]KAK3634273.1 hypothetical protein LTR22_019719 [Elasticomyces elasticus]KAK4915289.1 hypothetical protein LTR49_016558 [Elasticomyces elasticus]KAK5709577.1 hypothetical protein LTR17_019661 [Elasticomyces elasticus]KAK5754656.1 hypothetical protein LTS12_015261 [Elasticomyces elasticus]